MIDMRIDDSTVSPTRDEDKDMILTSSSETALNNSSVQALGFGNNCMNGIKWPPEHHTKTTSSGKEDATFNDLKLNPSLVTHGGRVLKKPARYMESDSDEGASARRKFPSAKKRKLLLSDSSRPKGKNGRTQSLEKDSSDLLLSHRIRGRLPPPERQNGESLGLKYELDLGSTPGVVSSLSTSPPSRTQPGESVCVKSRTSELQMESESSNSCETPLKRKRGRPPKNPTQSLEKVHSVDIRSNSPHGNCETSATKASLASPSTSKFGKKRKRSKGIRYLQENCLSSSSDENEKTPSTPRRRGRPPKKLLSSCETKHKIFRTPNGVKKPWVRPLLKAVDKGSFIKPSKKSLDLMLPSPEAFVTGINSKFVGVNGCRILSSGREVKRKRGRPPKPKPELSFESDNILSDAFHFTGEDEQSYGSPTLKRKLKKLKLPKKNDKRPLGTCTLKKREVTEKLKRKVLNKARKNLEVRAQLNVAQSDCKPLMEAKQSSENLHKRRRRNKADRILGMRRNLSGTYECLVQWKDGTSSWAPSDELSDYELDFKCFLGHEYQDMTVVNRLAYRAYWKEDLIEYHRNQCEIAGLAATDDGHSVQVSSVEHYFDGQVDDSGPCQKHYICKEVSVQKLNDCVHVTISRSSSKRSKINQRIVDSLTLVMEDAAIDESQFVVISGLGEETFCGVNLRDLTQVPCEEEPRHYRRDVDKVRYLVQVLIDFPKPVVAAIKRPALGLGAKLVSLCDLVCDEASLGEPVALQNVSKGRVPYGFAKLMGHTLINEQILIGHKVSTSQLDCLHSASEVFNHTRYTATVSASLKAMSLPNGMSYDDCMLTHHAADSLSELEQQLQEEEKKARNECIEEMKALWKEVHSQQPLDI